MLRAKPCMQLLRHFVRDLHLSLPNLLIPPSPHILHLIDATSDARKLRQIHAHMIVAGVGRHPSVATHLLSSPAHLQFDYALSIFAHIPHPNLFTWNIMLKKFVDKDPNCNGPPALLFYRDLLESGIRPNGHTFEPNKAFELFQEMRVVGLTPDSVAVATIISACGQLGNLAMTMNLHGFIIRGGIVVDEFVSCGLLNIYGDCGRLDLACQVFHEIIEFMNDYDDDVGDEEEDEADETLQGTFNEPATEMVALRDRIRNQLVEHQFGSL